MITLNKQNCNLEVSALAILSDTTAVKIISFKLLGRSNCPWVHYEKADGKRAATFLSPKAFTGYKWLNNYQEVVNLETGTKYQVTGTSCTCPDAFYRRRTCKHQKMWKQLTADLVSQIGVFIDETELPFGCWLVATEDFIWRQYRVECYTRKLRGKQWFIESVTLGYLREVDDRSHIFASLKTGSSHKFKSTKEAVLWMIQSSGYVLSEIAELYREKNPQKQSKNWLSIDEISSDSICIETEPKALTHAELVELELVLW